VLYTNISFLICNYSAEQPDKRGKPYRMLIADVIPTFQGHCINFWLEKRKQPNQGKVTTQILNLSWLTLIQITSSDNSSWHLKRISTQVGIRDHIENIKYRSDIDGLRAAAVI
jgi:hypothetical protein